MPYVHVQITRENDTSPEQKADVIEGVTRVLRDVLGKDPRSTFVVIEEVDLDNWGIDGLPVGEFRRRRASKS
ncbi:MAG: tautomerase [Planctomyces sp.]|nr:tautomerase [Planctomyces sp.]